MGRSRMKMVVLGTGLVLAGAAALVLGGVEPGHMPLHVGCRHHNHGAKWHADHGRILGTTRGRGARSEVPDGEELARRSLVAGRAKASNSARDGD